MREVQDKPLLFARCTSLARQRRIFEFTPSQCQKKDWPTHKPVCSPPDEQREFVQKAILRLQKDDRQFFALQYALAHNLLEDHGAQPDHRKLWVLVALVILHPIREPDLFSLFRLPNQPSSAQPLPEKSIMGGVRITGFIDASGTNKYTLDKNMRTIWNKYRAFLDKHGREKALAVLVQFQWRGTCVFVSPIGIDPDEFEDARKAATEKPPESWGIRSTNPFLLRLDDLFTRESSRYTCPQGPMDKRIIREYFSQVFERESSNGAKMDVIMLTCFAFSSMAPSIATRHSHIAFIERSTFRRSTERPGSLLRVSPEVWPDWRSLPASGIPRFLEHTSIHRETRDGLEKLELESVGSHHRS